MYNTTLSNDGMLLPYQLGDRRISEPSVFPTYLPPLFLSNVVSPTTRPRPPRSSTFRSLDCARLDAGATRGAWQQASQNHGMANYQPQLLQDFGTIKQYELRLLSHFGAMKSRVYTFIFHKRFQIPQS